MALLSHEAYRDNAKAAYDYVQNKMTVGASNKSWENIVKNTSSTNEKKDECVEKKMRPKTEALILEMKKKETERMKEFLREMYSDRIEGKTQYDWHKILTKKELDEAYTALNLSQNGLALEIDAQYAVIYGCGNCEEQSALTFKFLKDRGVKPLDWVRLEPWIRNVGAHAFVILGREGTKDIKSVSTWNKEVVWCDPYENEIGGLDKIKARFEGKNLTLLHRWGDT